MKTNKGFAPIIILSIVLGILVVGGGAYYLVSKKVNVPVVENSNLPFEQDKNIISNPTEVNTNINTNTNTNISKLELNMDNDGETITAIKGETIIITLGKGVTPYGFNKPKYDSSILKLTNHTHFNPPANSAPGNGGYDTFEFSTLNNGTSKIEINVSELGTSSKYASGINNQKFFSVTIVVGGTVSGKQIINKIDTNLPTIKLTSNDNMNGKVVDVQNGQKITVTLVNPGDGGYQFNTPSYDKSVLKLVSHINIPPVVMMPGASGNDVFEFQAIHNGSSKIEISASRSKTDIVYPFYAMILVK